MGKKLTFSKNIKYWLIPFSAVALLWVLSLSAWFYHQDTQEAKLKVETEVTGQQIKLRIESWVNHQLEVVDNIASEWEGKNSVNDSLFSRKAKELLSWIPGLQALNFVDDEWKIQIVVPLEGNEPALGKNLHLHPYKSVQESISKAENTKKVTRTTVLELLQGGTGFAVYWPVLDQENFVFGYINGVFKINKLVENCFSEPLLTERFSIRFSENGKTVYESDEYSMELSELSKSLPVQFVDKNIQMSIAPTPSYFISFKNDIPFSIFGFALLFSLWLGYLFRASLLHNNLMRESENRFRTVVESAGDAFFLFTKEGKIVDVNYQATVELQYSKEELMSMSLKDIDKEYEHGQNEIKRDSSITIDTTHTRKDGSTFPVEVNAGLVEINNKEYILSLSRNISEAKKLQELENRTQRLDIAGQVAGQVAHDFNNLLAPLIAYPDFIRGMLSDDHPAVDLITKIENSANQIAEINQQLLTLGRRGHYNQQIINLNDLIQQVIDDTDFCTKPCMIKTDFEKEIFNIKGGFSQIIRIVSNILMNAFDAIETEGVINIKTENYYLDESTSNYFCIPKGEYIKITISDNGHGIPSDVLPTIFDPFISTKKADKKRGSGLGLSVVDSVIKDHHGYVDVKSAVDKGTEFFVYFPISREEIVEVKPTDTIGGDEKILIVDDDEMILEVTRKILTLLGYTVKTALNGEIALELLQNETFDLLVLDMIIPNSIDGTEIFQKALSFNPTQKAIIVSGYAESERVTEALRLGVCSFMKKPFTKETLSHEIRKALQKEIIVSKKKLIKTNSVS